jgi:serine/threonine protein kinase/Tfp pilus assembly protein PilF
MLADYVAAYPELAEDREAIEELAFEEYRLRRRAREEVSEGEYEYRYGIDAFDWPYRLDEAGAARVSFGWSPAIDRATTAIRAADVEPAARSYLEFRLGPEGECGDVDSWCRTADVDPGPAKLIRDLHGSDPAGAERFARAVATLPKPGDEFLGFRLVHELGRGAFGRVYLALQGDLADRPVALKVSAELPGESRTLARLQHTNIVPIYSAHTIGPLHAVCMPYFGSATLADVYAELESHEAMPDSGEALVRTLDSKRSRLATRRAAGSTRKDAPAPESAEPEPEPSAVQLPDTLRQLGGLPFVEAVLWLGSRLADGLAHAHDRGILHRDLKPANVLLTDDGQPMILDFNLAEDRTRPEGAAVGGTLPYMAPEALALFLGRPGAIDARGDLYALGVILFELLTGRHPFEAHASASKETIGGMIDERRGRPPGLRAINPRVTPAEESIVHHLLDPDPLQRYQSSRDLHEDIERQLADLPLKHAPEPSMAERARKWARRHPRITSGTSIALMCGAVVLGLAVLLFLRGQRLARLEAYATLAQFRERLDTVEYLLNIQTSDRKRRQEGTDLAHQTLALYAAETDPAWRNRPVIARLDEPDRARLIEDVGELALVLARAHALEAADRPKGDERVAAAEAGLRVCDLAARCFDPDKPPKSLWAHRAALAALLGRGDEAKDLHAKAEATPLRTPGDLHRAASDLVVAGEYRKALPLALQATRDDPRSLASWFLLAFCNDRLDRLAEAVACYGTCIALRPEFPYPWLNRGIVQSRREESVQAVADFDRAAKLKPDWFEPYLNRAVANTARGEPAAAIHDVELALERGAPETRACFIRAEARQKLGDEKGALADVEAGLRREPEDAPGWFARGVARMAREPAAALNDFRAALKINPRMLPALQNCVYLLCELNRDDEALALLDRIIALYPDFAPARSSKGVLLAIKGDRAAAIHQAKESLWRDTTPRNVYQVAGIYATTSRKVPDDRLEAFRLLSTALRGGFGFEEMPDDHELDAIRDLPEFRELLAAAKALVKMPRPRESIPRGTGDDSTPGNGGMREPDHQLR